MEPSSLGYVYGRHTVVGSTLRERNTHILHASAELCEQLHTVTNPAGPLFVVDMHFTCHTVLIPAPISIPILLISTAGNDVLSAPITYYC